MRTDGGHAVVGYSHACPGGFGELMLLDEDILLEVPADLPDDFAACIEPLAVGLEHARRGRPEPTDAALVLGCGAIGLGVIAGLKLMGIAPIVAADFHESRRALALQMGAHIAVDPREISLMHRCPISGNRPGQYHLRMRWPAGHAAAGRGGCTVRRADRDGRLLHGRRAHVRIRGRRTSGSISSSRGGEEPQDMDLALRSIADGGIDVTPWLGERIGLGKVADAIATMSDPHAPVRTVVDPRRL